MPRKTYRNDSSYLWDMLESARAVVSMASGLPFGQYQGDRKTRRAIEREIEIIGEAAWNVSEAYRTAHPQIPWRKIIAQRHRLIHEYGGVDDTLVWRVATVHIPELIRLLEPLVPPPPPTP